MKRNNNFIIREIAGKSMLVPLGAETKKLSGLVLLNETGSYIWELLARNSSLDELANEVAHRFGVHFDRARSDVQYFLDDISKIGLLECDDNNSK